MLLKAKLGEKNKFYYDEKLKRWVEEGAESPAEEAALPPPPTTATFQNGGTDYNLRSALKKEAPSHDGSVEFPSPNPTPAENSSGIPLSHQAQTNSRLVGGWVFVQGTTSNV